MAVDLRNLFDQRKCSVGLVAAVAILGLLACKRTDPSDQGQDQPPPSSSTPGGAQPPAPQVPAKTRADAFRRDAVTQMKSRRWASCLKDLEEVAKLDPTGAPVPLDDSPEVRAVVASIGADAALTSVNAACTAGHATELEAKPGASGN